VRKILALSRLRRERWPKAGWGVGRYAAPGASRGRRRVSPVAVHCFPHPIRSAPPTTFPAGAEKGVRYRAHMDEPTFHQSSRKFARARRRAMTKAETLLWSALRDHGLAGHKFRRQTPIGPYFADFACLVRKLIVEADGRSHEGEDAALRDAARDVWFTRAGYRVLRFSDEMIIGGLPIVVEHIRAALAE
jgi:very-short-patch-repair endonuclease